MGCGVQGPLEVGPGGEARLEHERRGGLPVPVGARRSSRMRTKVRSASLPCRRDRNWPACRPGPAVEASGRRSPGRGGRSGSPGSSPGRSSSGGTPDRGPAWAGWLTATMWSASLFLLVQDAFGGAPVLRSLKESQLLHDLVRAHGEPTRGSFPFCSGC